MSHPANDDIHPRLRRVAKPIAATLGLSDQVEVDAALDDIQTLIYRCGYLLDFTHAESAWKRGQKVQRRLARGRGASVPRRAAGRPRGAVDSSAAQLGLGLATIFAQHTRLNPGRRWDLMNDCEYGPYYRFVQLVVDALPMVEWRQKRAVPNVSYLVRQSSRKHRQVQQMGTEAEHRGLLTEWGLDSVPR
jgi:hypothetical protein